MPDIAGALQNGRDWYTYFTRTRGMAPSRVMLLRDNQGSREHILAYAEQMARAVEPGGTLWFVFIGHGSPSRDGKDGILVGVDAQADEISIFARSVALRELTSTLVKGRQARTTLVVDACFSGRTPIGTALVANLQPLMAVPQAALDESVVMLAAGKSDQFAGALPLLDRPAFSYLVLGGLRGWADHNSDGRVTASEAIQFAHESILSVVKDRIQTPQLMSGKADAILATGVSEKAPDVAALSMSVPPAGSSPKPPAAIPGAAALLAAPPALPHEAPCKLADRNCESKCEKGEARSCAHVGLMHRYGFGSAHRTDFS